MNLRLPAFMFFLLIAVVVQAQTADQILDKYFAAIGGKDKWKAVKTTTTIQKMSMMGMDLPMTVYTKSPNKRKGVITFQGVEMVEAYDGKDAWTINPMKGNNTPQLLPVEEANAINDQNIDNTFIDYKGRGHAVNYLGVEDVGGTKCHKIELIKNKNNDKADVTEIHFFDAENYVPVVMKSYIQGQEASTYFSDYQEVNGLMFPFLQEVKLGDQVLTKLVVEKITVNDNLDDSIFAFPKK